MRSGPWEVTICTKYMRNWWVKVLSKEREIVSQQYHLVQFWERTRTFFWEIRPPTSHIYFTQFSSVAQSCPTLNHPVDCRAFLSITNSWSSLKLTSMESVMPSNHLILCHPLLLPPSIFPSIRVFSNESVLCMRWSKYWNFSFSISPSNEHPGLISFRMDCLDLLAVQGIRKSLLQHHSSKTSILWHSAFFTVQLSHPYMTTGKTLTRSSLD